MVSGLDAVEDNKNFWSGDDQGSVRSLFAFNNTDKSHTHYRHKNGYELIDNIEREGSQWISAYDERVHWGTGDGPISNGAIARRDNYLMPDSDINLSLNGYKGRANIKFKGSIPEGTSIKVCFDGRVVSTFGAGSRQGVMVIPSNVSSVSVRYIVPSNYIRTGNISPWRTTITGFKR